MSALSIVSPERRIELNPFDVDAWNLLLRESQARPIDQVRSFYEKLVTQFPNAGRYWKAYIDHECVDTIADGASLRNIKTSLGDRLKYCSIVLLFIVAFRLRFHTRLRGKNYE
uniref:Suppressor of forked domain-containing protein n=1 Tax=Parascaris univalens TaxID=6257 RepID=A0A915C9T1_PARUN